MLLYYGFFTESRSVQWTPLLSQQTITPLSYDALLMSKAFDYCLVETDSSNYLSKSFVFSIVKKHRLCHAGEFYSSRKRSCDRQTDRQGLLTSFLWCFCASATHVVLLFPVRPLIDVCRLHPVCSMLTNSNWWRNTLQNLVNFKILI